MAALMPTARSSCRQAGKRSPNNAVTAGCLWLLVVWLVGCQPSTDHNTDVNADSSTGTNTSTSTSTSTSTKANTRNNARKDTDAGALDGVSLTGVVPAYKQRAGDPEKGRYALLHESYVDCGIPARVFNELPSSVALAEVPGRDASMVGLPFSATLVEGRTGIDVVASNCLSCHGTNLFGELVIGLGNEFADFTQDPSVIVERAGALVRGAEEIAEWELFADRVAAIAPYTQMKTIGVNPANNLTLALMARRDAKTNRWLDKPALSLPPTDPPPVSVPPWWRMSKKHAMFSMSEGREDHARTMLAASMLCIDSVDELNTIDEYAPDVRAYLASIAPPAYPFDIDSELAADGEQVFNLNCASCHGTYAEPHTYPNMVTPINDVKTDALLIEFAMSDTGRQYVDWFNNSWFAELSLAAPARGYIAPPLDGIWATAPFLHNGSVPTLRQLLKTSERSTLWRHTAVSASDPSHYDQQNIGWKIEAIPEATSADPRSTQALAMDRRVYDTRREGYGNQGHSYGASLNEAAVGALLEYMKTL